jgi:hypothetical protein
MKPRPYQDTTKEEHVRKVKAMLLMEARDLSAKLKANECYLTTNEIKVLKTDIIKTII